MAVCIAIIVCVIIDNIITGVGIVEDYGRHNGQILLTNVKMFFFFVFLVIVCHDFFKKKKKKSIFASNDDHKGTLYHNFHQ